MLDLKNNKNLSFHRWTIDYLEDLRFVKSIQEFNYRNSFNMYDVLKLLKKTGNYENKFS